MEELEIGKPKKKYLTDQNIKINIFVAGKNSKEQKNIEPGIAHRFECLDPDQLLWVYLASICVLWFHANNI